MIPRRSSRFLRYLAAWLLAAAAAIPVPARAQDEAESTRLAAAPGKALVEWLSVVAQGLETAEQTASDGRSGDARQAVLRLYLDHYERVEAYFGTGAPYAVATLAPSVTKGEAGFHRVLQGEASSAELGALRAEMISLITAAQQADAANAFAGLPRAATETTTSSPVIRGGARTAEIRSILATLGEAETAYRAGDRARSLSLVEHAYLEGFEPLEARLAANVVSKVESLIHLRLRPEISRSAPTTRVAETFAALRGELLVADRSLRSEARFWFGVANSFVIVVREGLEAVLLIAALLAYLGAAGAGRRQTRQIYGGVAAGVAASLLTWVVARTLLPITGAGRELVEGVTAVVAVAVLLYVSHWLFQKTYIHDWKQYLKTQVGRAISTGSGLAMAGLAFAAVYREGFETVLFYQALLYDSGAGAVVAGLVPGLLVIVGLGVAIIRMGLKLPLKRVFGLTNGILLYLAFVFLGKGIYNLQEAGLFAPHPIAWLPDNDALRLLFGLYPIAETLLAQAVLLTALAGTYAYYRRFRLRSPVPQRAVPAA